MILKIIEIIILPIIAIIIGLLMLGLFRKIMARMHWRYGPPVTQPIIDIIRLLFQRSITHGIIFDYGLILSLAGTITVILFIPFAGISPLSGSGGLLVILYLMLISPIGIAISSASGANPYISIGISRKLMLSFAYEIPFIIIFRIK